MEHNKHSENTFIYKNISRERPQVKMIGFSSKVSLEKMVSFWKTVIQKKKALSQLDNDSSMCCGRLQYRAHNLAHPKYYYCPSTQTHSIALRTRNNEIPVRSWEMGKSSSQPDQILSFPSNGQMRAWRYPRDYRQQVSRMIISSQVRLTKKHSEVPQADAGRFRTYRIWVLKAHKKWRMTAHDLGEISQVSLLRCLPR